jgi:SAM-dependent methyltransferase
MDHYGYETYGARIAGVYDEWYAGYAEATVSVLVELAQGGRALELGIGTGRVAIPLAQQGVEVHGIDVSAEMVARLRTKPGGERIPVTMGNFAEVGVEGHYNLVYVLFNTFFALLTQEEQVRCFQNVASHLTPSGVFVIEAFVPELSRFTAQQALRVTRLGENEVHLDASQHNPPLQQITSQHVVLSGQGVQLYPVTIRYAWPSELDLMARLAGLRLRQRLANWQKAEFSAESGKHISIYTLL